MNSNTKLFKKEYALELFRIAENDLETGKVLATATKVRRETVLFNLEQAVEKSLKAVLCHYEKPIPFTHDIYAILLLFDQNNLPPGGYALHDLTPFASIRRYEEGKFIITVDDIQNALNLVEKVLNWAKLELNK